MAKATPKSTKDKKITSEDKKKSTPDLKNTAEVKKKAADDIKKSPETKKKIAVDTKKSGAKFKSPEMAQGEFSHTAAFWGLAVLLFFTPYYRGLFFNTEQEKALILAAFVFCFAWLWKWFKNDSSFLSQPLDYLALAFPVVYLMAAFQAANYGLAVDEVVKTTLYFLVYWLVSRLVRNEKDVLSILNVIYVSAVGVALAGLATATGIINIPDGFLGGRIYSTFQYPNALASYLAAVTILGFYLWRRAGSDGEKGFSMQHLYAAGNFILFAVLVGTKSQGGMLVFLIVTIAFIIGSLKGNRVPLSLHFVSVAILSFLAMWQFLTSVASNRMGLAWIWILLGLALTLAVQTLYSIGVKRDLLQWINEHRKPTLAAILVIAASGLTGLAVYITSHSVAVKALFDQIKVVSILSRAVFFKDALKMFAERPLLGWGGGGWDEAYRAYQSYWYNSTQVHGYYLQVALEAGIIGLLVILGVWAGFFYITHRTYHRNADGADNRFLIFTITMAAVSIGLHAAIDFDLSLSALTLVLWAMFGLARGIGIYSEIKDEPKKSKSFSLSRPAAPLCALAAAVVLIFLTGSVAYANYYAKQADTLFQQQKIDQGIAALNKAVACNPVNADNHSTLAYMYFQTKRYEQGLPEALKAIELSKYNAQRFISAANYYYSMKDKMPEAVNYAEKALALAPLQVQSYESLSRISLGAGYYSIMSDQQEASRQYFDNVTGIPDRIEDRMSMLSENEKKLWTVTQLLTATPQIKLNAGIAQCFLSEESEADLNLRSALQDEKTRGEASLWLALLLDRQGRTQESQELLAQAKILVPEKAKDFDSLRKYPTLP